MDHRPPGWAQSPVYFITICCQNRGPNQLCGKAAPEILRSIGFYNEKQRWYCGYAIVMPDHVHLLICFPPELSRFADIIGDWKRWLTKRHCIQWQENFFEHRLRDDKSYELKALYMENNPVRAGLVEKAKDWPRFWQPSV